MNQSYKRVSSSLLVTLTALYLYFWSRNSLAVWIASCPNRDVLGWDGNLRFTTSIDLWQLIAHLQPLDFLTTLLDSPTWPLLRSLIELPLLYYFNANPTLSVYVSLSFFSLTILLSFLFFLRFLSPISAAILQLLTAVILTHSRDLPHYALSGMLESQGGFFLLATLTALVWQRWRLFYLSLYLLLFTKYPYGILLLVALSIVVAIHYRSDSAALWRVLLPPLPWRRSTRFIVLLFAALLSLLSTALYLSGDVEFLSRKLLIQLWNLTILFFALDAALLLWRRHRELPLTNEPVDQVGLPRLIPLLRYGVLPSLFWMALHPDRFRSFLATSSLEQEGVSLFLTSISSEIYLPQIVGLFMLLLPLALLPRLYRYSPNSRLLFALICVALIHILIYDLSSNHQIRHIFHLIPLWSILALTSMSLLWPDLQRRLFLWLGRIQERRRFRHIDGDELPWLEQELAERQMKQQYYWRLRGESQLPIQLLALFVAGLILMGDGERSGRGYWSQRTLCFTDTNAALVEPTRRLEWQFEEHLRRAQADSQPRYLLRNRLHQTQLPHSYRASEIDLRLRVAAFQKGAMVRQSRQLRSRHEDQRGYHYLITISMQPDCIDEELYCMEILPLIP